MEFVNLFEFMASNAESLAPPVCNKMVFNNGILRIMIVGGPNQRKDYHLNLGEEIFYQVRGDMCLKVMECGEPKDITIREGEFFVLPGKIAHSPQRFENTIGVVVERMRNEGELDGLRYYVDDTNQQVLWQRFFPCTNLGVQLVPLIQEFFASKAFESRVPEEGMPVAAWEPDATMLLPAPFVLAHRFQDVNAEGHPPARLANKEFVVLMVSHATTTPALPIETEVWVWLLSGTATVTNEAGETGELMKAGDTVLLMQGLHGLVVGDGGKVLVVYSTAC